MCFWHVLFIAGSIHNAEGRVWCIAKGVYAEGGRPPFLGGANHQWDKMGHFKNCIPGASIKLREY